MNGTNLLNRTATRAHLLEVCKRKRPGWSFTRVSEGTLDTLEHKLRGWIDDQVARLPATTHTVKF